MRIIALDVHRSFAQTAILENGKLRDAGKVDLERNRLLQLARKLKLDDQIVIEAPGNTSSIVRLLSPFVGRVVIANPNLVRAIAWAKVKTDISSSGIHTSGRNPLAWSFASTAASIYITIQLPKVELKNGLTLVREVRVRRPV